jgi:hypothetical protein
MVEALGITEDGMKRVLGLRQGARENAEVCAALLEDLGGRGLDTGRPMLFVLDGAKALHAAVTRVWGKWVESGGPLCENARRNHTSVPRAETPLCKRERL